MMLSACTTNTPPKVEPQPSLEQQVPITQEQFDCGPEVYVFPDGDVLMNWSDRRFYEFATDSWEWGKRCYDVNEYNRAYFFCKIKKDESACRIVNALVRKEDHDQQQENR